jgi:hypothetical protein
MKSNYHVLDESQQALKTIRFVWAMAKKSCLQ